MVNNQLSIISKKREFILEKLLLDLETEDPQIPRSTLSYRRSTSVENALQINPFMQNKPNFQKSQVNVSSVLTKDYENKSNWTLGENKPNSNPNKPNLPEGKIDAKCVVTKDYEEKCG